MSEANTAANEIWRPSPEDVARQERDRDTYTRLECLRIAGAGSMPDLDFAKTLYAWATGG